MAIESTVDPGSEPVDPNDALVKSYRYLRMSMVILVIVLGTSVLIEWRKSIGPNGLHCFQGSISSYYYTPVQPILVGALLAIGTCLIAVKGNTNWEDVALNLAGMLAPVVALVPTSDQGVCMSVKFQGQGTGPGISNNIVALMIGGAAAIVFAFLGSMSDVNSRKITTKSIKRPSQVGLLIALALMVGELLWYTRAHEKFLKNAHFTAAVFMFVFVGIASATNGLHFKRTWNPLHWFSLKDGRFAWFYRTVPVVMAVAGIAIMVIGGTYKVLILEASEIVIFAAYWWVQTTEHWWDGITRVSQA